jgi:hypothetical protein
MVVAETKLWRAVLQQAYDDAELAPFTDDTDPAERVRACSYLRADDPTEQENLSLVCEFADVPLDRVVTFARRRYPLAA